MKGAGFCLLYQGFYYIEVYYIESRVHLENKIAIFSLVPNSEGALIRPETRYSKPRYSKNLDIVNKTQLPSWDFIEVLYLDIVNDLI